MKTFGALAATAILLVLLVLLLESPTRSLVIDELGTYWVIKDGIGEVFQRALTYHGQSPLYYVIVWLFKELVGKSEWILRCPSLIAVIVSAIILYYLCLSWLDKETALIAGVIYVAHGTIMNSAASARPYGIAILFALASMLALSSLLRTARTRSQCWFIITTALTVYTHYFFAGIFLIHLIYFFLHWPKNTSVRLRTFLLSYTIVGILLLPLVPQILHLAQRQAELSWVPEAAPIELLPGIWFSSPIIIEACLAAALIVYSYKKTSTRHSPAIFVTRPVIITLLSWYFLAPLILYFFATFSGSNIFSLRYFQWNLPALSMLMALLVVLSSNAKSIRILLLCLFVGLMAFQKTRIEDSENWADAAAHIREQMAKEKAPLLLYSGLIESSQLHWLTATEQKSYLSSPLAYYPIPAEITLLPWHLDSPASQEYVRSVIDDIEQSHSRFYILMRLTLPFPHQLLENQLSPLGYRFRDRQHFDNVVVGIFEKQGL